MLVHVIIHSRGLSQGWALGQRVCDREALSIKADGSSLEKFDMKFQVIGANTEKEIEIEGLSPMWAEQDLNCCSKGSRREPALH